MNKALEELRLTYGNAPYLRLDLGLPQTSTLTLNETIIPALGRSLNALEIIKNNLCGKLVFKWHKLGNVGSVELHREDGFIMTILTIDTKEEYDLLKEVLL